MIPSLRAASMDVDPKRDRLVLLESPRTVEQIMQSQLFMLKMQNPWALESDLTRVTSLSVNCSVSSVLQFFKIVY